MSAPISPALVEVLRQGRASFNARFAQARARLPGLDADGFGEALVASLEPLVAGVTAERRLTVASAAYDVVLELVAQRRIGRGARDGRLGAAWRELLPAAAGQIERAPERVLAALANALVHLGGWPDARPEAWARGMAALAKGAEVDAWLAAGQVLAWRAGLAHLRAAALDVADSLPPAIALAAVGAPAGASWPELAARLRADPWHLTADRRRLDVVARVGGFRGFGGLFMTPPRVRVATALAPGSAAAFVVEAEDEAWFLFADADGATWHRAGKAAPPERSPRTDGVSWRGAHLMVAGRPVALPLHGDITSVAAGPRTLAVTSAHSHAVVLVAADP